MIVAQKVFQFDCRLEDGPSSHTTPSSSSFGRAAGFVKGYGTYASELFRGAFLRAKSVVSSRYLIYLK